MPRSKPTTETAVILSPQLLAEARSDTARKWIVQTLCVGADPELFFPRLATAQPPKHGTSARCAPSAASAWRTRSRPASRSASGAASTHASGRACAGSSRSRKRPQTHTREARRDAGTAPPARQDRRKRPVVASHGARRSGRGGPRRDPRPPGTAGRSRRRTDTRGTSRPRTIRRPAARLRTERRPGTQTPTVT